MKCGSSERSIWTSKAWRIVAPLLIWLFIMAALWAHKTHNDLSEKTFVTFTTTLAASSAVGSKATIDGNEIESGGRVSVGPHLFAVSHPKAEDFSKRIFVWYRENNLGEIPLTRSKGSIAIRASPAAPVITIRGSEFTASYKDLSETNITVATDEYQIEARYRNWNKKEEVRVASGAVNSVKFAPPFGSLRIVSNYPEVAYRLSQTNTEGSAEGNLPYEEAFLPEGTYQLVAKHRNTRKETTVIVKAGETNDVHLEFLYGAAFLKTEPLGATVIRNNEVIGKTPIFLPELEPGDWTFVLRHDGYEPLSANIKVLPSSTNEFEAKLVNEKYSDSIRAARNYLGSGQFDLARQAASAALAIDGSDDVALALMHEASGLEDLRLAQMFARDGDYTSALKKLQSALAELPHSGQISTLIDEYRTEQQKRYLNRGNKAFGTILSQYDGANLFETYRLTSRKSVYEAEQETLKAFSTGDPAYTVTSLGRSVPESFCLKASYVMPLLSTKSGRRDIIIVGTQTQTNETEILFKILEYKPDVSKPITEFGKITYAPMHPSRIGPLPVRLQAQVKEGIADVTARIKRAVE